MTTPNTPNTAAPDLNADLNAVLDDVSKAMSQGADDEASAQAITRLLVGRRDLTRGLAADDPALIDEMILAPWLDALAADLAETGHTFTSPPTAILIDLGLSLHADLWAPLRADLAAAAPRLKALAHHFPLPLPDDPLALGIASPRPPSPPAALVFALLGDRQRGCVREADLQRPLTRADLEASPLRRYRDHLTRHIEGALSAARDRLRAESLRRAGDARVAVLDAFRRLDDHRSWQGAPARLLDLLDEWAQASLDIAAHLLASPLHSLDSELLLRVLAATAHLLGRTRPYDQTAGIQHYGPTAEILDRLRKQPNDLTAEELRLTRTEALLLHALDDTTKPPHRLLRRLADRADTTDGTNKPTAEARAAASLLAKLRDHVHAHLDRTPSDGSFSTDSDPAPTHRRRQARYAPPRRDSRGPSAYFRQNITGPLRGHRWDLLRPALSALLGEPLARALTFQRPETIDARGALIPSTLTPEEHHHLDRLLDATLDHVCATTRAPYHLVLLAADEPHPQVALAATPPQGVLADLVAAEGHVWLGTPSEHTALHPVALAWQGSLLELLHADLSPADDEARALDLHALQGARAWLAERVPSPPPSPAIDPYRPSYDPPPTTARSRSARGGASPLTATIIGAGVTGLTAAHELAERGFRVQVVERRHGPDARGRHDLVVGGIAASQWSRPRRDLADPIPQWPERAAEVRHDDEGGVDLRFQRGTIHLEDPLAALAALLPLAVRLAHTVDTADPTKPSTWHLELRGHADQGDDHVDDDGARRLADRRAHRVAALLLALAHLVRRQAGEGDRASLQRRLRRLPPGRGARHVELRVADVALPGEHGYRFFPSFYRHLFDTMRRTPLYDADGHETERTVFDNLVPTDTQLFSGTFQSVGLRRGRPASIEAFRRDLQRVLIDLGFERRDIARFAARMLRYMTASKGRRAHYEDLTWWDFLIARGFAADGAPAWFPPDHAARLRPRRQGPDDGRPRDLRSPFSPDFEAQLKAAPQALVAMDAETCDARTQGNIVVQLMLDQILERGDTTDCTLNGPTTTAWLDPWRRHLGRLGVRFFHGDLDAIRKDPLKDDDHLDLIWDLPPSPVAPASTPFEEGDDYVVLATDVVAAERVTRLLRDDQHRGVPADLDGFTTHVLDRDPATGRIRAGALRPDAPFTDPRSGRRLDWPLFGRTAEDRLQLFSGVQYYFRHDLELGRGHVYYQDTPWGLSSISPLQFWRRRAELRDRGVLGILSVDIGDFRRPSRYLGRPAYAARRDQIAEEVWRQMSESLRRGRDRGRVEGSQVLPIPHPVHFHIDDHLLFGLRGCTTLAPFLVNQAGDWQRRPGVEPWDPSHPERTSERGDDPHVWQAAHGGYQVHFDRLVFAGTYLRTFTRMTTMEAANESARHAVNAILDHLTARGARLRLARKGESFTPPDFLTTLEETAIAGDYCKVWDPERHELDDLDFFKRTDALLVAAGKPHMFDILGIEELLDRLLPDQDPIEALFAALGRTLRSDWSLDGGDHGLGLSALQGLQGDLRQRLDDELRAGLGRLLQPGQGQNPLAALRDLLDLLRRR